MRSETRLKLSQAWTVNGILLAHLSISLLFFTDSVYPAPLGCPVPYTLYSSSEKLEMQIDGNADEAAWQRSAKLRSFSYPWDKREAPETFFQALLDPEYLLLFFYATETTYLNPQGAEEMIVATGDRVEVFFSLDPELSKYFCLEISPSALVLDYEASYYREFRPEWDMPGLQVAAVASPESYTVEAAIPIASMLDLGFPRPVQGTRYMAGLFRAEFLQRPNGVEQNWISWCHPAVDDPDFHVPSAFGFLEVTPLD